MAEVTFKVGDHNYRTRPMDARMQFHIATKFVAMGSAFSASADPTSAIGDALMALKPDDADFIFNACLAVIDREIGQDAGWTPVLVGGQIAFEDVRTSLATLLQLVVPVVRSNATDFFAELPKELIAKLITALPGGLSLST